MTFETYVNGPALLKTAEEVEKKKKKKKNWIIPAAAVGLAAAGGIAYATNKDVREFVDTNAAKASKAVEKTTKDTAQKLRYLKSKYTDSNFGRRPNVGPSGPFPRKG